MKPEMLSHVITLREQGYQLAQRQYVYNDQRPLEYNRINKQSYDHSLPSWNNASLIALIKDKTYQKDITPDNPVRILDAGCGPFAVCLRDIKKRWPTIECFGVNADITEKNLRYLNNHEHISVIKGDVQNLHLLYPENSMDIVTSLKVFPYLPDPFMTIVGIHQVLKPGGVALISDVPISPVIPDLEQDNTKYHRFLDTLRSLGMEVRDRMTANRYHLHFECDISFQKQTPELVLPLTYTGNTIQQTVQMTSTENPDFDAYWYNSVEYRFVE